MTYLSQIITTDATLHTDTDHVAYMAAYAKARSRAACSYFDQHIIRTDDGCYWVADEGDYESLMQDLVDRIVHTVDAGRSDEH
jgi:hypothetical protein